MRYVTLSELTNMIRQNLWKIPHDIDLVVGIPRSGLMVASIMALYLNKRLADIDSFLNGQIMNCGKRGDCIKKECTKKILVVDDSVWSGNAMTAAKDKTKGLLSQFNFIFFSPIVTSFGKEYVDIFFEVIDDERIFEWNLFHHSFIGNSCLDIDGVLCCDPEEDDDGEKYTAFLKNASPLFLPTVPIDTLITCRLEKYRELTEEWLKKNEISYGRLIMLNLPDKTSRIKWGKHGEYKGEYYQKSDCKLFIESSHHEAVTIAKVSNKPVICIETNELLFVAQETKIKKTKRIIRKKIPKTYHLIHTLRLLLKNNAFSP